MLKQEKFLRKGGIRKIMLEYIKSTIVVAIESYIKHFQIRKLIWRNNEVKMFLYLDVSL